MLLVTSFSGLGLGSDHHVSSQGYYGWSVGATNLGGRYDGERTREGTPRSAHNPFGGRDDLLS